MLKDPIQEAFEEFHQKNPKVYELFVRFARMLKGKGITRASAKLIVERIRWEIYLETSDKEFKINNNYTSRYARLAMEEHQDLASFFETRILHPKSMRDLLVPV